VLPWNSTVWSSTFFTPSSDQHTVEDRGRVDVDLGIGVLLERVDDVIGSHRRAVAELTPGRRVYVQTEASALGLKLVAGIGWRMFVSGR
jgi:hypothetical protein